jgi:hypothetical protein
VADVNEEIIGAIGVSVTGDYSSLAASYSSAQDQASAAGEAIADAFNEGVSGVADAADVVTDSLSGIGPAADDAGGSLEDFADDAGDAGEAAEGASSQLAEMAEQLTAVGEALVITEGLTELGSEALSAADGITKASIALTNITGSGDVAHETIEGLEQLGMSDGLAMPSLLSAATRMQQILGPSADVVEELGQVANGAAIMGTDIETAATKFDQMATAGTASARTLTSLGISLSGLATAFNVVEGGSDATADSVAAMFKALDQSQRVEVLNQALSTLGGTAQQVAEQTFGGQWQQLANAWEGIMVQVGQAILPVVSDILQLTKTEIVPFLQGAISEFNSLPTPIKDAAVAVGLLAAAVIPVTGALAAVGLAVTGLEGLLPALGALMATIGGEAEVAAVAEHAQAAATAEMGIAAAAAAPEVEALAVAEQQLSFGFASELLPAIGLVGEQLSLELLPGIEGVGTGLAALTTDVGAAGLGLMALGPITGLLVLSVASLKDGWNQAASTFANVSGTIQQLPGYMSAVSSAGGTLGTVATDLKGAWDTVLTAFENYNTYSLVAKGINEIVDAVDLLTGIVPGATAMTAGMTAEINKLQTAATTSKVATDAMAASFQAAALAAQDGGNALTPVQLAIGNIVVAQDKATAAYQTARAAYDVLSNSLATGTAIYNGSAANANEVAKALSNMQTAAAAAGIGLAPIPGSMQAISDMANKLANSGTAVVSSLQEQANEQAVANASLDLAQRAYIASDAALDAYVSQLHDAQTANDGSATAVAAVVTAEQNVQKAYAASQKASDAYTTTVQNYISTLPDMAAGETTAVKGLETFQDALGPALSALLGLDAAVNRFGSDLPNFGVQTVALSTGPLAGLQSAYAEATDKVAKFQAQMAAGQNVGAQYEKALSQQLTDLINLNVATAEQATGLQGATDAYSLATIAVAAAQAKLDTLNQAVQTNITLSPQVTQAQNALATAQAHLAQLTGATTTATNAATAANQNLAASAPSVVGGLNAIGTAAQNATSQLNDVAQAVQGVQADMQAAFGSTATSGGSVGAPAGYTIGQNPLLTGVGDFGTESFDYSYIPLPGTTYKQALAAAQALMPAKGTSPTALAQDALAQAQAVLDVDTQYFGQTFSGAPTAQDIQTAQQAVTTAQSALSALTSGSAAAGGATSTTPQPLNSTYSGSSSTSASAVSAITDPTAAAQAVVNALNSLSGGGPTSALAQQIDQLENIILNGGGLTVSQAGQLQTLLSQAGLSANGTWNNGSGGSTTGTAGSSTPVASSSSGSGTSAIDGGSYPAVTAHQASGEIWAVDASGVASSGGGTVSAPSDSSSSLTTAAGATTDAANATSDAAGDTMSAAGQLSSAAGSLLSVAATLGPLLQGTSLNSIGGGGTAAAGAVIASGGGGTSGSASSGTGLEGTSLNSTGGGGTAAAGGAITNLFPSDPSVGTALSISAAQAVEAALATLPASDAAISAQIKSLEDAFIKGGGGGLTQAQENELLSLLSEVGLTPNGTAATSANLPYQPAVNLPNYNPVGGPTSSTGGTSGTTTVNVTIDARGSVGLNTAQVQSQITTAVTAALVRQLFTNGARLTQ